jgi:CRISPR-associated protein Cas2
MRVLITYDTSSDKRRRNIVKLLEGYGYRVQYSVFEFEISKQQLAEITQQLVKLITGETEDSVRIYALCATCAAERVTVIGKDHAQTLGPVLII